MTLRTQNLSDTQWEIGLPNSIRSLLSTAMNPTPVNDSSGSSIDPLVDPLYLPGCPPQVM